MIHDSNIKTVGELGLRVETLANIPDLIGAAFSVDGLILTEADLGPEFFRLGSGVSGALFQKLVNCRVPTALVLEDFAAYGERVAELASEHSRHLAVRFVTSEVAARVWLGSQLSQ